MKAVVMKAAKLKLKRVLIQFRNATASSDVEMLRSPLTW
jgi:hypothetical protein